MRPDCRSSDRQSLTYLGVADPLAVKVSQLMLAKSPAWSEVNTMTRSWMPVTSVVRVVVVVCQFCHPPVGAMVRLPISAPVAESRCRRAVPVVPAGAPEAMRAWIWSTLVAGSVPKSTRL